MSPPCVACFHGGGSNSAVFSAQCERLQQILKQDLEFIFFDGPFEREAGPGVLPYFEGYAPFRSWLRVEDGKETTSADGIDGIERIWMLMAARRPRVQWAGVMGFSQGTRVAGGLLLDHQMRQKRKQDENGWNIQFGVMCMGSGAPVVRTIDEQSTPELSPTRITIPTLHLHGLRDVLLERGREQLKSYYDQDTASLLEINYHHAMPWFIHDLSRFAASVKQLATANVNP